MTHRNKSRPRRQPSRDPPNASNVVCQAYPVPWPSKRRPLVALRRRRVRTTGRVDWQCAADGPLMMKRRWLGPWPGQEIGENEKKKAEPPAFQTLSGCDSHPCTVHTYTSPVGRVVCCSSSRKVSVSLSRVAHATLAQAVRHPIPCSNCASARPTDARASASTLSVCLPTNTPLPLQAISRDPERDQGAWLLPRLGQGFLVEHPLGRFPNLSGASCLQTGAKKT